MPSSSDLYNSLLSIDEANSKFVNRDEILSKLGQIFKRDPRFGVCIVHRHCKLKDGEVMVATGNVSEPRKGVRAYPERWLASGEAYEFNSEPTITPPESLFTAFREIVGSGSVLGVCYLQKEDRIGVPDVTLEHTDGRRNITTRVNKRGPNDIITCFKFDTEGRATYAGVCVQVAGTHYKRKLAALGVGTGVWSWTWTPLTGDVQQVTKRTSDTGKAKWEWEWCWTKSSGENTNKTASTDSADEGIVEGKGTFSWVWIETENGEMVGNTSGEITGNGTLKWKWTPEDED